MPTTGEPRTEPAPQILAAARQWLAPVRAALAADFVSACLTGSVLNSTFHPKKSRVNVLIVARSLAPEVLDRVGPMLKPGRDPAYEPLFVTQDEIQKSLDVFPIEWLDIRERHLLLDGEDLFSRLDVSRDALRIQCEHELRGKHLRLRQVYLSAHGRPRPLADTLRGASSGLSVIFRTLLRLRGEAPPANSHLIERIAALYGLDAAALSTAHHLRHSSHRPKGDEIDRMYRRFLVELGRLIAAVDVLPRP